jgi:cytochrome P450
MTESFSRAPFRSARKDLRDVVSTPVHTWIAANSARKTIEAFRVLTEIPMDLAAAGFEVAVKQDEQGWHIDVAKDLGDGSVLQLNGAAQSYAGALFQIANEADRTIDDLQRMARKAWEASQKEAV